MNDILKHFEARIRVDYTYRSPSAKKVAEEIASRLNGRSHEMPPIAGLSQPEVRIELSVSCPKVDLLVVSVDTFTPKEFNQIREKKSYLDCKREILLHNLVEFLCSKFREKLGWTGENKSS